MIGATVAAGGAGLAAWPGASEAAVTQDSLTVDGGTYESPRGDPYSPWLDVTGAWTFDLPEPASGWRTRLLLSSDGVDWAVVAADGGSVDAAAASGSYAIAAAVVDHAGFEDATFDAPLGETIEVPVYAKTVFAALDAADNPLAEASAADRVDLTVTATGVKPTANVTGTGGTRWQANRTDGPPG